jgi:DNA polymerase
MSRRAGFRKRDIADGPQKLDSDGMSAEPARRDLADILAFYAEAGVDAVLEEAAIDRLQPPAPPAAAVAAPTPLRAPAAPPPPDAAAGAARQAAMTAGSLDELRRLMEAFEGCALKSTARGLVFSDGIPAARLMLVGEAPGVEEDRQGKPFVGRSGQLLDRMLAAIGLDRQSVYIANVIPWRPPGNRTPTPAEIATCKPFIARQIALCDPDVLVCLGGPAMQALSPFGDGILKTRGRWFRYDTGQREIDAVATLHPAYLLRQPLQKRLAWRDFKAIRAKLQSLPPR